MEKIARICWNSDNWTRPSGPLGKSKEKNAYENRFGFGHEEWLLDDSKIMPDGYHYAFLQPINTKNRKHEGQTYDIHLITFNSLNRQKGYVGLIKNVECLTEEQSKTAYKYYKEKGWLDEMLEDIRNATGNSEDIQFDELMFNIRFKMENSVINYSNCPIIKEEDLNTKGLYYNLMDKKAEFCYKQDEEGNIDIVNPLNTTPYICNIKQDNYAVDPIHKKMQNFLAEFLKDEYIKIELEKGEKTLSSSLRIDIIGIHKKTGEVHYFEVKTSSAKQSIREAFGQIMEYSHYNHKSSRAQKLYIIGRSQPDEKDAAYLKKLRAMYNLPIWYRWCSLSDNKIYEEI